MSVEDAKPSQDRLTVVPCDFDEACSFVLQHHRHHKPPVGHKFSLAVADSSGKVRAVCMVGRPVARVLDNGMTLEVTRLASDGCKNACSCLYAAAWRAAKSLGYQRLVTYILNTESGTSLNASGWRLVGERGGAVGIAALGRESTSIRSRRSFCGRLVK